MLSFLERQKGTRYISYSYGMNRGTAKIINYAHKNNLAVQYWTINDKKDME